MKKCFICNKRIWEFWQESDYTRLNYRTKIGINIEKRQYYHVKCIEKETIGPPTLPY